MKKGASIIEVKGSAVAVISQNSADYISLTDIAKHKEPDRAAVWRDSGRCIISGFHSPVEQECLRILLRGKQPIIICPARSLPKRIQPECRHPLASGRLLILSAFPETATRVTADLAHRRNEIVAALADEAYFAHITPGGEMERLSRIDDWTYAHRYGKT